MNIDKRKKRQHGKSWINEISGAVDNEKDKRSYKTGRCGRYSGKPNYNNRQ